MNNYPLKQLETLGQSIWLDHIRRNLIARGELRRLIEEDGLPGMTSNPSIFEKAIVESHDYDEDIFGSARFKKLADNGARVQRLLWASTGTKNPDYSDVKYIDSLIGPDTVNTVPVETLDAYRDHGDPNARLEQDVERAGWVIK